MANEEHLRILRQGTAQWYKWRATHREILLDLSGADLSGADLSGADLSGANLGGANLGGANLSSANLSSANLGGANLRGVYLSGVYLSGANLSDANLSDANLSDANLSDANLSFADLSHANLSHANLSHANLSHANLNLAITYRTVFDDLDLRVVKGLETVKHAGPSGITTSTLERSEWDIPEAFLRGAGLSDTFITYARSLVRSPIQYYTCFISYSSQDQAFTERLYADLQSKGIRCWYGPEDLKIGDFFEERIDEAIRIYDKLLVILSEHSISSSWVEEEVRAAREKEQRFWQEQQFHKTVLFPIAIDQAFEQAPTEWATGLRKQRHIGKFTHWKDHDSYQQAFQRLLRDLKADTKHQSRAI